MFEKLHSFEKAGMEILSIHLKATKSSWLDLYNVYLPNTSTQHNLFDPSLIKPGPSSLLLGDLNGHFQMWDPIQPQDQRGDEILDWILNNDLHILNDGPALELVESLEMTAPPTSPFVGATGQQNHSGD